MKPQDSCVVFVAAATCVLHACVSAQPAQADCSKPLRDTISLTATASTPALPDIDNFDCVSATLFRGSAPNDKDIDNLKQLGVKTIVDLRMRASRKERQTAAAAGIQYMHMPLGYWAPSKQRIEDVMSVLNDASRGPIYLHCRQGADRTGMCIAIYRIMVDNWSFNRAYKEMRAHHFKPWWFALRERVETCAENSAIAER